MNLKLSFLSVCAGLLFTINIQAQSIQRDTSSQVLVASATKSLKATVVLRKANIVFPEVFKDHKEESESYIRDFAKNRRNDVINLYQKSSKFFPKAKATMKKYGVPVEFLALIAIESGFNSKIVSPAGAVGWWQFMDATAKDYGMKIIEQPKKEDVAAAKTKSATPAIAPATTPTLPTVKVVEPTDDRWHFAKSTNAAARYLRDSYRVLGDWLLVAASYNCGVGRVKNAMAATGKAKPSFWDVKPYLPSETKNYVMKLIAFNTLWKNYNSFQKQDLIFDDITTEVEQLVPYSGEENVL